MAAVEFRQSMRKLWETQLTYTRSYITSALAELPDAEAASERLLLNQDEIGAALRPYYGADASQKLARLLREQIKLVIDVVQAASSGDRETLALRLQKWAENGIQIVDVLCEANPNWSRSNLVERLEQHRALTTVEILARIHRDWETDIKAHDANRAHMLRFSDLLVDGIVEQFPEQFPR